MALHTESSGFDGLLRWLATYRLAIYVGGLLAIATPRLLRTVGDVTVEPTLRTVIVVVSMAVMILTYLGERRSRDATSGPESDPTAGTRRSGSETIDAGTDGRSKGRVTTGSEPESTTETPDRSGDHPQYSRRTRAVFAAGIVGVVFGVYVALESSVPAGLLFVFGAILFVQSAYRRERGGESG